jgi:hypothetical protein
MGSVSIFSKQSWYYVTNGAIIAGAGKTKLVSKVIDSLINEPSTSEGVAYFYCNRNENQRCQAQEILASFVKQLSISRDQFNVHKSLLNLYEEKKKAGSFSNVIRVEESESLLNDLSRSYTRTTLVLDALDECDEENRSVVLEVINQLVENASMVNVFISSRRDRDIQTQLRKKANIGVEATDNQEDVAKFVTEAIAKNRRYRETHGWIQITRDLEIVIIETLLAKSGGMYVINNSSPQAL